MVRIPDFPIPPQKAVSDEFMRYGNCRGMDPEAFFPQRGETLKERAARTVCRDCTVRNECLEYALTAPYEKHGIWGGYSEKERRRLRMRMRSESA